MIMKKILSICVMFLFVFGFVGEVYAARLNGEIIYARDLAIGEIVTTNKGDAMVVGVGDTPRLVMLANFGNSVYGGTGSARAYDSSTLKGAINTAMAGHADYIFNISAPFLHDIAQGNGTDSSARGQLIDARLAQGGHFWTRTPYGSYTTYVWYVHSDGYVYSHVASHSSGVRPAFNLKSGTLLIWNSATQKYTVGGDSPTGNTVLDQAITKYNMFGVDTVMYLPEGSVPAGYTLMYGDEKLYYKKVKNGFVIVLVEHYTAPTSIGDLIIN